jgi:hypothetical protein
MYSARMRLASSVAFNTVSSSGVFMVHASIVRAQKREMNFFPILVLEGANGPSLLLRQDH